MNKLKIKDKYLYYIESLFLYLFLAYSILGANSFTYGHKIILFVMWPMLVLGFLIVLYRVINFKDYFKMPGLIPLLAMLCSIGISTLVNYRYNFKANFIFCVFWVLYFCVLYTVKNDRDTDTVKKYAENAAKFFILFTTLSVIASFILLAMDYSEIVVIEETHFSFYRGFAIGRLWGVFSSVNSGAVSAAVSSVMLLYFILKSKKIWVGILCGIDIFLQLMFIALADSRSGAVCTGVTFGTFTIVMLIYKTKEKKAHFKVLAAVLCVAVIISGYFVPRLLKDGYNEVCIAIAEYKTENVEPGDESAGETKYEPNVIDRGYDLSDDISNRRFDVWLGGIKLFLDSPKNMIVGTSFKGFPEYAKEHQPDNYLVNNDLSILTTLDNEAVNILVAQGAFGFICAAALVIAVLRTIIKGFFKVKEKNRALIAMFLSVVLGLSSSAMFGSIFFYHTAPNAVIFWPMLGAAVFILKRETESNKNEQN